MARDNPMIAKMLIAALVTCHPALAALFTPPHPQLGRYEVCTTPEPIEALAPPGVAIGTLGPLDAFGAAGPYDRFTLARLYGGRRVRIARAWTTRGGVFESQTFLTPYPDATLTHLIGGTMIIRFQISRSL